MPIDSIRLDFGDDGRQVTLADIRSSKIDETIKSRLCACQMTQKEEQLMIMPPAEFRQTVSILSCNCLPLSRARLEDPA